MTANVFTRLEEEIDRCVNAWLTPARQAIIAGMVGELIESRTESQSDSALGFRLGKMVEKRFELRFPISLHIAAQVLDNLMSNASPVLISQDKQLEQAVRDGGKVFDLSDKAPPLPAELSAKPEPKSGIKAIVEAKPIPRAPTS